MEDYVVAKATNHKAWVRGGPFTDWVKAASRHTPKMFYLTADSVCSKA
jgi:hypothetical protein